MSVVSSLVRPAYAANLAWHANIVSLQAALTQLLGPYLVPQCSELTSASTAKLFQSLQVHFRLVRPLVTECDDD